MIANKHFLLEIIFSLSLHFHRIHFPHGKLSKLSGPIKKHSPHSSVLTNSQRGSTWQIWHTGTICAPWITPNCGCNLSKQAIVAGATPLRQWAMSNVANNGAQICVSLSASPAQQQWAANDDGKIQIKDALKVTKYTNKQTNKRPKDGWRSLDGWMDGQMGGWVRQANKSNRMNRRRRRQKWRQNGESIASGWLLDGIGLAERSRWPCNFQLSSRWWHTIMCPNYVNQVIRINALIINPLVRSVLVISSAYDTQTLRI